MQVQDYTYKDISCVSENSSLQRVIKAMKLHRISAMPIVSPLGDYIGCISEQDILNASVPEYMKSIYNTSFMADLDQVTKHLQNIIHEKAIKFVDKDYPCISPHDSMSYAADLFHRTKRTVLPVVEGKRLIGLITRIDILSVSMNE